MRNGQSPQEETGTTRIFFGNVLKFEILTGENNRGKGTRTSRGGEAEVLAGEKQY